MNKHNWNKHKNQNNLEYQKSDPISFITLIPKGNRNYTVTKERLQNIHTDISNPKQLRKFKPCMSSNLAIHNDEAIRKLGSVAGSESCLNFRNEL